jgi:phosphohistidine swiveling domain-containing protein
MWILGATKYKHKKIKNNITEDITIFYKDNSRQLRGFNANQPPLNDATINSLNEGDLNQYILEYNALDKKIIDLMPKFNTSILNNDFKQIKKLFKKIIKYNLQINAYEYLINALAHPLFNTLSLSSLNNFNTWKNNENKNNYPIYSQLFTYLINHFQINISLEYLFLYSHVSEIMNILDGKLKISTLMSRIEKRKDGFVLLNLNDKKCNNKVITNSLFIKAIEHYFESLENKDLMTSKDINEVKGQATFKSSIKIRGECVVLKNNYDKQDDIFNKILVCPVTTAEDVHRYIDTRALIVDHGGFLSHAAIFSREINKPCLMGCGIATKVFTTGDIIELDLEKEIVYKIN